MNLHENNQDFSELIRLTADKFNILPIFIEKDYWITRALHRMAQNPNTVIPGVTSKGSRFYKAIYTYPVIVEQASTTAVKSGQLLVEINTYANPYPYIKQKITSFITEFLIATKQQETIEQYGLQPFTLNVLDKRRTIVEKLVSLIRFSFSADSIKALASKIRHFYDLYYLVNDTECLRYIQSSAFKADLSELLSHDQQEIDEPKGWQTKSISESPLATNFSEIWKSLRSVYQSELTHLAFVEIPNEQLIEKSFENIIQWIR